MKRGWLIALMLMALTSCDDANKDSYYIEQHSLLNPEEWDKVVLIFGYGQSNAEMCNDLVKAMRVKVSDAPHPAQYRCVPAN
jgi:hypothetical protein